MKPLTLSIVSLLIALTSIFNGPFAYASVTCDDRSLLLISQVQSQYASLQSISAKFEAESIASAPHETKMSFYEHSTGSIKMMKPNLLVITESDTIDTVANGKSEKSFTYVSDGKDTWHLATDKYAKKKIIKRSAPEFGAKMLPSDPAKIDLFFKGTLVPSASENTINVHYIGTKEFNSKSYNVIVATILDPDSSRGTECQYFIGDDFIVYHTELTVFELSQGVRRVTITQKSTIYDLSLDQDTDKSVFRFMPPDGIPVITEKQLQQSATKDYLLPVGSHAPSFTLQTPAGGEINFSEFFGSHKATIINFWFRACGWCMVEMPYLQKVPSEFKTANIGLISVNSGDSSETILSFLKRMNYSFPVVAMDSQHQVLKTYNSSYACPTTYLLDSSGRIIWRAEGYKDSTISDLRKAICTLLTPPQASEKSK